VLFAYSPQKDDELELLEGHYVFVSASDQGQTGKKRGSREREREGGRERFGGGRREGKGERGGQEREISEHY
jgi:hypothetical protein